LGQNSSLGTKEWGSNTIRYGSSPFSQRWLLCLGLWPWI